MAWIVQAGIGDFLRQILLFQKVPFAQVTVLVVFAIPQLFHQAGGCIANVHGYRQIAVLPYQGNSIFYGHIRGIAFGAGRKVSYTLAENDPAFGMANFAHGIKAGIGHHQRGRISVANIFAGQYNQPSGDDRASGSSSAGKTLKVAGLITLVLAFIGVAVWAIFQFLIPMMQSGTNPDTEVVVAADTTETIMPAPPVTDSLPDSAALPQPVVPDFSDTSVNYSWKAYIRLNEQKANADNRLKLYKGYGHNVFLETRDSLNYNIYIALESRLADTARKRDSLSRFFAQPVKLEPLIQQ